MVLYLLNLNGVNIPSFVKVNAVKYSILPPIENNFLKVRGKKEYYFTGQDLGQRKIEAEVTITSTGPNKVMARMTQLAEWLYHEEEVKLIIEDTPDKYYLVVLDGETNIEEIVSTGKGTISFLCTQPFAFGYLHEVPYTPTSDQPYYFNVVGNAPSFPEVELTVKENITDISIVADNGLVMIGEPETIDKTPTNKKPLRLSDTMANTSNWTAGTSVDGGTVAGTFSTNGYSFSQASKDYGTGSQWHGAAAIRSLPSPIQDFEVNADIGLISSKVGQIGRVEVYLLDANNNHVGKVSLKDVATNGNYMTFEARAGNYSGGKYFVREEKRNGVWANFSGRIQIGRKGKKWYAHIGQYDSTKKIYHSRLSREWYDVKNQFSSKVAKIQIHIAAFATREAYNNAFIGDIKVHEHVELTSTQTPIIAETGDVLLIDSSKSIVYKNGEPFFEGINPVTTFFPLQKGLNGLAVSPAKADVVVRYTERWL